MGEAQTDTEIDLSDVEALAEKTTVTVGTLNSRISDVLDAADELYFDYVVGDVSGHRVANGNVHFDLDYGNANFPTTAGSTGQSSSLPSLPRSSCS